MTFSRCSNCDILNFANHRQLPFKTVTFFLNTLHTCNCFLLGQEKSGHGTISWLHVSAVVHNSASMQPIHKIIDCTTCITDKYFNFATYSHDLWGLIQSIGWSSWRGMHYKHPITMQAFGLMVQSASLWPLHFTIYLQCHLSTSLNSYCEESLCIICLPTTIPSPCYCINLLSTDLNTLL
jgi:hypothetical protein